MHTHHLLQVQETVDGSSGHRLPGAQERTATTNQTDVNNPAVEIDGIHSSVTDGRSSILTQTVSLYF